MQFKVMNRSEAIQYAKNKHAERAAIVSITSRNRSNASLSIGGGNNIQSIIFLSFDDTESTYIAKTSVMWYNKYITMKGEARGKSCAN